MVVIVGFVLHGVSDLVEHQLSKLEDFWKALFFDVYEDMSPPFLLLFLYNVDDELIGIEIELENLDSVLADRVGGDGLGI